MPLLKTRNSTIAVPAGNPAAAINIDGLREDGSYPLASESGGGTFPVGAVFPVTVVVSSGGTVQTLTDDVATVFTRNFGFAWWGDWV